MARIDWAVLCDRAFFDRQDRLCIVGIVGTLAIPRLPLALSQMMLVAHLIIQSVEEVAVSIAVLTRVGIDDVGRAKGRRLTI